MKQIEVKAKTVHEAIEDACTQLGVSADEISVEILSQGGMFGKAKILVTVNQAEEKPAPKEEPKPVETKKIEPVEIKKEEPRKVVEHRPAPASTGVSKFDKSLAFITTLLDLMESDVDIHTETTENAFNINVTGDNIGRLIGKNGMVMNALQTLVTSIAISNSHGESKRVFLNIGDYREKRTDSVQSLALKKADYVKKTGRFVKLDPMNARERAIIHTALQGIPGIKTYSTGKDPFRCLCIAPTDAPTGEDRAVDVKLPTPDEDNDAI